MNTSKAFSSSRLVIKLLGEFTVFIDGQKLSNTAIKGRKARKLLKILAHQRKYQIVREHAIDILWPELKVKAASTQLYKAIYHIRQAFRKHNKGAEDWIKISENFLRIAPPGGLVTDLNLFQKFARTGLKDKKKTELESAASIYGGEFLPMERYAGWASFPREHFRQLYLDVLTYLAEVYEEQEEFSEAAEMLRYALDKEPTLEAAHQGLMRIFAKKGQSTRAFHQYNICKEILQEELGLALSPQTNKTLDDVQEGKFC
ncbi:DNA-binding SARP family transcriptional activator [Catalinimonas alkaloidigena]|uniref:AfsR/SARP family transcriptional regulator n=1 Tax=Catalinimonas alkaloidigena TaxID=1075417 RepID=UPI002405A1FE|nr:BTAD domain-containing putative transcriptional regulator [Catalinimonas alkaloidigena]MDF9796262.1 DNA-binding SARP family transcriptional activator [Catalinimonas alkaloidigena]